MKSHWSCNLKRLSIYSIKKDTIGIMQVNLGKGSEVDLGQSRHWYTDFGDIKFRHPNSIIVVWKKNNNTGFEIYTSKMLPDLMLLFLFVLPSFHLSICLSIHLPFCLSVHLPDPSHNSTTIHHMIMFLVHWCRIVISLGNFLFFKNFNS